jgi:hypothetical protein
MLELMAIAELLLLPLAKSLRDQAVDRIASAAVDGAHDQVAGWLKGVGETQDQAGRAALRSELAEDPALAAGLRDAISSLPGMPDLPSGRAELPSNATDALLDVYSEVLYQFLLTAIWIGRPLAIEGFLQGDDWIAVCQSATADGMQAFRREDGVPLFPESNDLWERSRNGGDRSLIRPDRWGPLDSVEFRVRHVPDASEREDELRVLTERWEHEPQFLLAERKTSIVRPENAEPFEKRWHTVTEIRARMVPLPAAPLRDFPEFTAEASTVPSVAASRAVTQIERPLAFSGYPPEALPLVKITDGPAAVAGVRRRLIAVLQADQELADAAQQALGVL